MDPNPRASESACPDRDTLAAFSCGRLPDDPLELIAEHVSSCARCATILEELQVKDTVVFRLRRSSADKPVVDEAVCAQLAEQARAILEAESVPATVNGTGAAEVLPVPRLPAVFGPYLLLERIGQGGMGIVYKARQETLKRLVALKMIRAGSYASAEERLRFQREGEAIARIRHGHVVQIHDFGEHEGQMYFSMELLEGGTLSSRLHKGPLPEREAAELVRALAQAVAAAHEQEVVHRDLKPRNVLFAADGTAKITDFGLAKVLDSGSSVTCTDAIMGTPAYMAPEQVRGEGWKIGRATDVYALGVILYETLTGNLPFCGESRSQTLELVRTAEPELPSRRRPGLARDLEAICLKCLEKEPKQRYPSAAALAEDLQRWLDGQTIQARPMRCYHRALRKIRRNPATFTAIGVLIVLIVLLSSLPYLLDPQRKVERFQTRLRRGETVTLIGQTGGPAWSRWPLRPGALVTAGAGGNVFTISAHDAALLQLLEDPQRSYRLTAQVRHDDGSRDSEVGLFFLHSEHDIASGRHHCFCTLTYNDHEALHPQAGQLSSLVSCKVCRAHVPTSGDQGNLAGEFFTPAALINPTETPWRELAVEARSDEISVFWQGQCFAQLSRARIIAQFQVPKLRWSNGKPVDLYPDLQPTFGPRGALGLYVSNGKASFRHVVVQPLEEP